MQGNSPFTNRPPLPTPDGNVFAPEPTPIVARGDWKSAPFVIRCCAYPLTWLGIIIPPCFVLFVFFQKSPVSEEKIFLTVLAGLCAFFAISLNDVLLTGKHSGWIIQLIVSVLGLLWFPIGTAINTYILSQWFKPETKAWFGKN